MLTSFEALFLTLCRVLFGELNRYYYLRKFELPTYWEKEVACFNKITNAGNFVREDDRERVETSIFLYYVLVYIVVQIWWQNRVLSYKLRCSIALSYNLGQVAAILYHNVFFRVRLIIRWLSGHETARFV